MSRTFNEVLGPARRCRAETWAAAVWQKRADGFTLMELLVVVAEPVVLAGLPF